MKVAAEDADYVNLYLTSPKEFRRLRELGCEYCESLGRGGDELGFTWHGTLLITKDEKAARIALEKKKKESRNPNIVKMSFDEYRDTAVIGTTDDCLHKLQEFKDAGASYFIPTIRQVDEPALLETIRHDLVRPLKK